jgi:hypothetical protein
MAGFPTGYFLFVSSPALSHVDSLVTLRSLRPCTLRPHYCKRNSEFPRNSWHIAPACSRKESDVNFTEQSYSLTGVPQGLNPVFYCCGSYRDSHIDGLGAGERCRRPCLCYLLFPYLRYFRIE